MCQGFNCKAGRREITSLLRTVILLDVLECVHDTYTV